MAKAIIVDMGKGCCRNDRCDMTCEELAQKPVLVVRYLENAQGSARLAHHCRHVSRALGVSVESLMEDRKES